MNIKQFLFTVIVFAGFTSCSVDYDLGDTFVNEPDYIVVNSLLSPGKPIKIDFYRTAKTDSGYSFVPLEGAYVLLKENDKVLYDTVCESAVLEIPYHPKAGQSYSLEASVEGKTVTANTFVPVPATCRTYLNQGNWQERYLHFSDFRIDMQKQTSLWITSYEIYNTGDVSQCRIIYTNHPLVDKFNWENGGPGPFNPNVGPHYHDMFLRIKNTNLPEFDDLIFEPTFSYYFIEYPDNYWLLPDWETPQAVQYQIKLIMASNEYDRYCKTLYIQKGSVDVDDELSAIFYQPTQVYSNIEGGLGIFAGMSETNYYFNRPSDY